MVDLTVLIVNFNTKNLTLKCLESLYQQKSSNKFQTIVVDNNSTDGSVDAIRKYFPKVMVISKNENLGFSKGNNVGIERAHSKYILFLNSDTKLQGDVIDKSIKLMEDNQFDMIGCKLLNSDGSFQPNAGELPTPFNLFLWISGLDDILGTTNTYHARSLRYYKDLREVGWISGAFILADLAKIKKIGGFDEKIFMYGEDVDLCFRFKKDHFKVGWTDQIKVVHYGGKSSSDPKFRQWLGEFKGLLYLYKKNYGIVPSMFLRVLIYLFIGVRVIAFNLIGKFNFAKTYVQVAVNL